MVRNVNIEKFKPMLLSNDEFNLEDLDYSNMYISIKRDGVRAEMTDEGIKNRSLKTLRNKKIQEYFQESWKYLEPGMILEGEIYCDGIPCREMAGICNSLDKDVPAGTKLYVFGVYNEYENFEKRIKHLKIIEEMLPEKDRIYFVPQCKTISHELATIFYDQAIADGFEGCVMMDGRKDYKCGRVTIKQHIGFKLKPVKEEDLLILNVAERMENTNESQTNELGRSFKRNTVADKKATGIAATFICKYGDIETKVTITGDEESRREIWKNREEYKGRYVVVKSMDYGVKDKPRHPRMIGIKEAVEK